MDRSKLLLGLGGYLAKDALRNIVRPTARRLANKAVRQTLNRKRHVVGEIRLPNKMARRYPTRRRYGRKRRRFTRRRNRFVRRNVRKVGYRVGSGLSRRYQVGLEEQPLFRSTRVLYPIDLTDIPLEDATMQTHARSRGMVNLLGWKIDVHAFINNTNDILFPCTYHCAVIAPKRSATVSSEDFFRNPGTTTDNSRGIDFTTSVGSISLNTLAINEDKFNILTRKKMRLQPFATTHVRNEKGSSTNSISFWLPFHRQLRYDEDATPKCMTPVYFMYWMEEDFTGAAGIPKTNVWKTTWKMEAFFRNSGGC